MCTRVLGSGVAGVYAPAFVERRCPGTSWPTSVSPEFMLRPSLSDDATRRRRLDGPRRVAGVYAPAFVERSPYPDRRSLSLRSGVAGVYAPAFVERKERLDVVTTSRAVSPEFMLRPSLSDPNSRDGHGGTNDRVSPEFMLRPSLSDPASMPDGWVSPEFMLRPSLSGCGKTIRATAPCVAGVYAPAFVERSGPVTRWGPRYAERVAGVYAPAFVERVGTTVSERGRELCRRSLCSGLR